VHVLDSSVLVALMKAEPASEGLLRFFDGSLMCAINHSEVLQKMVQLGGSIQTTATMLAGFDFRVVPFDLELSTETASLWPLTSHRGLSLADRSCIALARATSGIAVTADRAWKDLDIPDVAIHVIDR